MHRYTTLLVLSASLLSGGVAIAQPVPPQTIPPRPMMVRAALPHYEIATIVRSLDFEPLGRPVLHGPVYRLRALDPDDLEVVLTINARTGRVLAAAPVILTAYPPPRVWPNARVVRVVPDEGVRPGAAPTGHAAPLPRARPDIAAGPAPAVTGSVPTPPAEPLSKPAQYPVQPLE